MDDVEELNVRSEIENIKIVIVEIKNTKQLGINYIILNLERRRRINLNGQYARHEFEEHDKVLIYA